MTDGPPGFAPGETAKTPRRAPCLCCHGLGGEGGREGGKEGGCPNVRQETN